MAARTKSTVKKALAYASRKAAQPKAEVWDLRLYVADERPSCRRAYEHLRSFCEDHLAGRYRIEVIDLLKSPEIAKRDQIVAIPTLVRRRPLPVRTVIGDLADTGRMMTGLDVPYEDLLCLC